MGKINLAEGIKLKSILNRRIQELNEELQRSAFALVEKGKKPETGRRPMAEIEQELERVRKDSRSLDGLVYRANIDHEVEFEGSKLPIVEAIEFATQLRAQASAYKSFSQAQKEEIQFGYSEGTVVYRIALFDPEDYRKKAEEAERRAHKLSNAVNAKNYTVILDFDDSAYY
ncbi:hypothetical protein SAMN04488127_3136 [Bhargavaea ginsengi]|uniref:Uncharacterized protein n=1 Tax=Bhargavaea ginsengi TaxID=426757 RepID=A0A1H7CE44_9BACL|nr:hypothetical protein [Bhargavaea ginsengi]SEJ87726.1 hypothetical protein SAMN04488127_3136 [Bhargavaea ginsengi]